MVINGISIQPLIDNLNSHKCYTDDDYPLRSLKSLRSITETLKLHGYYVTECHLILKPSGKERAKKLFGDQEIDIVNGCRILEPVIGTVNACGKFRNDKSPSIQIIKKIERSR